MKVAVVGANRSGLCAALVLAQAHRVVLLDHRRLRVHSVNAAISPVDEPEVGHYLEYRSERLRATLYAFDAFQDADLVVVTTPTRYDHQTRTMDTSALDGVLQQALQFNDHAPIVIESSIPTGYTARMSAALACDRLVAAPVLVQRGRVLNDRLHPASLVVGHLSGAGRFYAQALNAALPGPGVVPMFTGPGEAEAIHLFAHKQLLSGHPVSGNHLAHYAYLHHLDLQQLVDGLDRHPPPTDHGQVPVLTPLASWPNAANDENVTKTLLAT